MSRTRLFRFGRVHVVWLLVLSLGVFACLFATTRLDPARAAEDVKKDGPVQVEEDDYIFMETAFEPPYERLLEALKAEPADKKAWKQVASDALILAELSHSLLNRESAEDEEWTDYSKMSRDDAAKVYKAARDKKYDVAVEQFGRMVSSCNGCHDEYGGPELKK